MGKSNLYCLTLIAAEKPDSRAGFDTNHRQLNSLASINVRLEYDMLRNVLV